MGKKERKDEKDAFEAAKKDDEAAIKLLEKAKDALEKYHKDKELLLQETRVTQPMPDATFTKKDKNKNENKGIVGIMEMLIEDLTLEIENGEKAEKNAIKEFEAAMKAANKLLDA